jgi:hypothetical protein
MDMESLFRRNGAISNFITYKVSIPKDDVPSSSAIEMTQQMHLADPLPSYVGRQNSPTSTHIGLRNLKSPQHRFQPKSIAQSFMAQTCLKTAQWHQTASEVIYKLQ